jgi:hypothetical protein
VQSNTNVPPVPTRPKILVTPEPRTEPKSEPAPKNSPPKTPIPVLGTPYPVSMEKRGTVPGDGTHEEPKSEPIRVRAITAGHADKEAHVKGATAPPRPDVSATQPRADVSTTQPRAPVLPNHGPGKRPVVPVIPVTLPSGTAPKQPKEAGPVSAPLLSPPSTAPKKSPTPPMSPKTPGIQKVAPPTPPPRAKTPVATSPKEPRRSYSLQTLN